MPLLPLFGRSSPLCTRLVDKMAALLSGPDPALLHDGKKNEAGKYVPVMAANVPVRMRDDVRVSLV